MTTPRRRDPEVGVTLVEMLVAVAICALVGIAGFTMLDTILRTNDRAEESLDRLADLERTFLVIGRDLAQAEPGSVRIEAGSLHLQDTGDTGDLSLAYAVEDDDLVRLTGEPVLHQHLVSGVAEAAWRALDPEGAWRDEWPAEGSAAAYPRGLELSLRLSNDISGTVRRLFLLTAGPES